MHRKETSAHKGQVFLVWQGSLCSKPPEILSSVGPIKMSLPEVWNYFSQSVSHFVEAVPYEPSIQRLVLSFLLSVPWVLLPGVPSWAPTVDFHPLSSPWMLLRWSIWWIRLLQETLHLLMAYPPNPILNIWNHYKWERMKRNMGN